MGTRLLRNVLLVMLFRRMGSWRTGFKVSLAQRRTKDAVTLTWCQSFSIRKMEVGTPGISVRTDGQLWRQREQESGWRHEGVCGAQETGPAGRSQDLSGPGNSGNELAWRRRKPKEAQGSNEKLRSQLLAQIREHKQLAEAKRAFMANV